MKIMTTHVGSLPGPADFDTSTHDQAEMRRAVQWVVEQQRATGLDIINEGELTKGGDWLSFMDNRLGGFEERPMSGAGSILMKGKDREAFADFYRYAAERQTLFFTPDARIAPRRRYTAATGPVTYTGMASLTPEIEVFRSVVGDTTDAFLTSTAPASLEVYRGNEYYKTTEEFVWALAEALRVEYEAIVNAGFLLQVDDPHLVTYWIKRSDLTLEQYRKWAQLRVEALNHALRNIPPERVRHHTCYGINMGPRVSDMELKHLADLIITIKAGYYSFEMANPRHEHEWRVWEQVRLPDDKVLIPGCVTHASVIVEHPDLVAERILRLAGVVGRERIIAGSDCGFASTLALNQPPEVEPEIVWAKFASLAEGARIASKTLWT